MYKRMITPVEVSRNAVDKGVRNELECVSNNTLANLLLQLSSLSKMSEDLFTEVHLETCRVFYRTCQIIKRVEALKYKIIQLNPIAEEGFNYVLNRFIEKFQNENFYSTF